MKVKIDESGKHKFLFEIKKGDVSILQNLRMVCNYNDFVKEIKSHYPQLTDEEAKCLVYSYYEGYSNIKEV